MNDCDVIVYLEKSDCIKKYQRKERYKRTIIFIILLFLIVVLIGTIVFKFMFDIDWIDALYTAVLIITGINIEVTPTTVGEKLFVIVYSVLVVVIFLSMANVAMQYLFELSD